MVKEINFSLSESHALLKQPLCVVLNGVELTMDDADISDCEIKISGDRYDFSIRATKKPSENHEEKKPD